MNKEAVGVRLENLAKAFPVFGKAEEFFAVDHINLKVAPGEMVTLLGPSGCGKTTILRMLAGFETPTEGNIFIGDKEISRTPPNKRNVGMMFQSYALFPHLSVFENVAYGLRIKKVPSSEIQERVANVLDLMQIRDYGKRMPNQLSGGQQQRVALARAVVTEPLILLFDEPLSNLDAKLREYMRDELRKIQQRVGITSLYVTHDQSEAMAISDKIVIMKSGTIRQEGSAKDIYTFPKSQFVANFMGSANFIPVTIKKQDSSRTYVSLLGKNLEVPSQAVKELDEAVCMVRPEFLFFDKQGAYSGKILEKTYLGQIIQYKIECQDNILTMVDYRYLQEKEPNIDDTVPFDMHMGRYCFLPKTDGNR
jgi:iron(III) transport system ATP-binding protein